MKNINDQMAPGKLKCACVLDDLVIPDCMYQAEGGPTARRILCFSKPNVILVLELDVFANTTRPAQFILPAKFANQFYEIRNSTLENGEQVLPKLTRRLAPYYQRILGNYNMDVEGVEPKGGRA